MKLEKLAEIMYNDEKVDKKKIIKILSDGIECEKCEKEIFKCLYKEIYGDVLVPSLCEELISTFKNADSSGAVWTLEETNNVAKKLEIEFKDKPYTAEEFRTAMTMEYYEHNIPLKKSSITLDGVDWGRMADYALKNNPGKLVKYFFCKADE